MLLARNLWMYFVHLYAASRHLLHSPHASHRTLLTLSSFIPQCIDHTALPYPSPRISRIAPTPLTPLSSLIHLVVVHSPLFQHANNTYYIYHSRTLLLCYFVRLSTLPFLLAIFIRARSVWWMLLCIRQMQILHSVRRHCGEQTTRFSKESKTFRIIGTRQGLPYYNVSCLIVECVPVSFLIPRVSIKRRFSIRACRS